MNAIHFDVNLISKIHYRKSYIIMIMYGEKKKLFRSIKHSYLSLMLEMVSQLNQLDSMKKKVISSIVMNQCIIMFHMIIY